MKKMYASNKLVMLSLLLALQACSSGEQEAVEAVDSESPQAAVVEVRTMTLQPQSLRPEIQVVGVVQSTEKVELSAEVSAPVAKLLTDEGRRVARGDLLIELDAEKLQLRLTRAREAHKQARSRLGEATSALERRKQLAEQNTLSQESLDNAKYEYRHARAAVEAASAAVRLAERGLRDAQIVSPVDGVVDTLMVEAGEAVMPGDELLVLQATGSLEVQTHVSERDINYLLEGASAEVEISEWRQHRYPASVQSVGIAANPRTGNFPVTLLLTTVDQSVRPGMTARATIVGTPIDDVLLLPEQALVDRQRQRVVFVEQQGVAVQKVPQLKAGLGDQILVLDGLQAGDRIIVDGLHRVIDGIAVSAHPQVKAAE